MRNIIKVSLTFLALILVISRPTLSYAWHGEHHEHHEGHAFFGLNLSLWPERYYYHDVVYYDEPDYVLVSPQPVTVVQAAPAVTTIQTTATTPTQVMATPTTTNTQESFTVNIPNDKGGYTAVTLKRSGNGFVGPQGEFYSEFPKVSQLKAMYGR